MNDQGHRLNKNSHLHVAEIVLDAIEKKGNVCTINLQNQQFFILIFLEGIIITKL